MGDDSYFHCIFIEYSFDNLYDVFKQSCMEEEDAQNIKEQIDLEEYLVSLREDN